LVLGTDSSVISQSNKINWAPYRRLA